MPKALIIVFVALLALGLSSCNLFNNDDDPEIYTGGSVTEVTFAVSSPTSVTLTWEEDFTDEDGFYVDRQAWDGGWQEWEKKILTVDADVHTAIDTDADLGTSYRYRVYAFKGDAVSDEIAWDYNFWLPYPQNLDYDFSWATPTRIRFFWDNIAPWADSIVVAKRPAGEEWTPHYATLPGNATEYMDSSYDVSIDNTWGFTAYYQEHISSQYTITMMAP